LFRYELCYILTFLRAIVDLKCGMLCIEQHFVDKEGILVTAAQRLYAA
jgi:hypothetical protein